MNEFITITETDVNNSLLEKNNIHDYIISRRQNIKAFKCCFARLPSIYVGKHSLNFDKF